jgi:hypothetical protein
MQTILADSKGKQQKFLGKAELIDDWIMLIETLFMMEAWLMQPNLKVASVERLTLKMKEEVMMMMMMMMKQVGK